MNIKKYFKTVVTTVFYLPLKSLLFYQPIVASLYGLDISNIEWLKLGNFIEYFIFLAVGFLFYKYIIAKDYLVIRKIREFKMSFESANYLFVVYLLVLAVIVIIRPF